MKLLSGSEIAGFIKQRQAGQVRHLRGSGVAPKLAIVQVKDDPVINTYVKLKQQYGADLGVEVEVHKPKQSEVPELLNMLSNDETVHGIIVQLPLEDPSQTDEIVNLVAPQKDVDALGDPDAPWPPNVSRLQGAGEQRTEVYGKYSEGAAKPATPQSATSAGGAAGSASRQTGAVRGSWFQPATPMAILWLLSGYNIDLKDKKILLIGRGKLVGAPLEKLLQSSGFDVEVVERGVEDLASHTKAADVIITATGSPAILHPDMIKRSAVVVDAGVASEEGKTVGDLDPKVYERDDLTITPEKGGVGPLTVCALFENVIQAAQKLS